MILAEQAAPAAPSNDRLAEVARLRARAALIRKRIKTPLEDALASGDGQKAVRLVQWARAQREAYDTQLGTWRANRVKWAQEAQDIFDHRASARKKEAETLDSDRASVFEARNESLNIVASLAEFAAAQAEQDIYGAEPWFAARPEGRADPKLAEEIQKHLQWTLRDGRYVDQQCQAIDIAVSLGECFTKTYYDIKTDEYESQVWCLHIDGKPATDANGLYITTDEQVQALGRFAGKIEWKPAFEKRQTVIGQGVEVSLLHFNDIAFREDAPELSLEHTNVYVAVEMTVGEAKRKFNLSAEDARRLALAADMKKVTGEEKAKEQQADAVATAPSATQEDTLATDDENQMLNTRVRLVEGYIKADILGTGSPARVCIIFPPLNEDWILWADYLANISPKAELPIKVKVWEPIPHKLYGRGFFSKYSYVQTGTDELWNAVSFRNAMHANPITAIRAENIQRDEDDGETIIIKPGLSITPKAGKTLGDCMEFAELPDLDNRSMELLQIGHQIAQLRSGITSAAQGDLSGVPESNTATGIRSLMSRAAVLLKKPIRRLRRSDGRQFAYMVKLFYSNFDREEAFVHGEGENAELVTMSPEKVADLDIDVRMTLTQEQNQTKLEGSQAAMSLGQFYTSLMPEDRVQWFPIVEQGLKALEFDTSTFKAPQLPLAIPQAYPTDPASGAPAPTSAPSPQTPPIP